MSLEVVILAAGKGTRMRSALPKVMHLLSGKPLLKHVIDCAKQLSADKIHVVYGHGGESVKQSIADNEINWVEQANQLGTGHAVAQAIPAIGEAATVLVLYGDVPLTSVETLTTLLETTGQSKLGVLTVDLDDPSGYGRIVRDENGSIHSIVEHKDANPNQLQINEVNTGILATQSKDLKKWLPQLSADNAQGEYYLTDIIAIARQANVEVVASQPEYEQEVSGVNNRAQLAELERWWQLRQAQSLMRDGITLADPNRIDCRGHITHGQDIFIDVNVVLQGRVNIADNVVIGPNCVISDCEIGSGTTIAANSVLESCSIGEECQVGPFARIRPGSRLANRAKVGNFVETKKALVGEGSKINHLSYVGDTTIGKYVNVGAGTITCNYDGVNKHQTVLEDDVFVGSNTALVAPVKIGCRATIGAGSIVTQDVSDDQLAVARSKQRNIDGWKRPKKDK